MDHDCNEGGVGDRFFILHQPGSALPLIRRSVDAILDFAFLARASKKGNSPKTKTARWRAFS